MSTSLAIEHAKTSIGPLRALSPEYRVGVLADRLAMHIESLVPRGRARCLDVGGGDTTLADAVRARAPRTDWRCIDVNDFPAELRDDRDSSACRAFDGDASPDAEREFDIALVCDVLHHTPDNAAQLLGEAGRVAQRVLVKDRFEYGSYSRAMLRLMDAVDHWGAPLRGLPRGAPGSKVPPRYFTREGFARLAAEQGFIITALDCGLSMHEHVPVARTVLRPDAHFIAVLRRI